MGRNPYGEYLGDGGVSVVESADWNGSVSSISSVGTNRSDVSSGVGNWGSNSLVSGWSSDNGVLGNNWGGVSVSRNWSGVGNWVSAAVDESVVQSKSVVSQTAVSNGWLSNVLNSGLSNVLNSGLSNILNSGLSNSVNVVTSGDLAAYNSRSGHSGGNGVGGSIGNSQESNESYSLEKITEFQVSSTLTNEISVEISSKY